MSIYRFVSVLALIFLSKSIIAQTTSFIQYGVENGLIQSQVQCIEQDNDGNLWIGTLAGVSKFNGIDFVSYNKRTGLAEDWITCSLKDRNGNIYFGHWGGGISLYNYTAKSFKDLLFEEVVKFKGISKLAEDKAGIIWIATKGGGLYKYDPAKNKTIAITISQGLISNFITDLCFDNNQNLWIATDKGVSILTNLSEVIKTGDIISFNTNNGLFTNHLTCIASVLKHEIWIGSEDMGVMIIQLDKLNTIKKFNSLSSFKTAVVGTKEGLLSLMIQKIIQDFNGNIWIATKQGGVVKYIPSTEVNRNVNLAAGYYQPYSIKQGLSYYNVNALFQGREKNVWIGTDLGLNLYQGERFQIFDEADGVSNNIVWSVLSDNNDNIWLGTNYGLTKLSPQDGTMEGVSKYVITKYAEKEGLVNNIVISIYEDKTGVLWFGTFDGGVYKLNPGSSRFESISSKDGLPNNTVYSINSDEAGNIWFGTKEGASKYDPINKKFTNYNSNTGLGGNYIYRIFKDSKGNLWFGSLGGYLTMYDGVNFKIFDDEKQIDSRFVLCIAEDRAKNIWLGSYGNGLYKYDGKKFTNLNYQDGLSSDSPYSIVSDKDNNLWIGTNQGVDKYNQTDNSFSHYGRSEGFLGVEANANAICLDRQQNIWFGTIMGAVKFNREEDKPNPIPPQVTLTGIKIHLKDAEWPKDNVFTYNQNHITFFFNGVSLTNPKRVKYQYRLEGLDEEWSPVTNISQAVYSNLAPGSYKFMLRAANGDGVWTKEFVEYSFSVVPPFWQTMWFRLLLVMGVIFTVLLMIRMRTRKLKEENYELEEKVRERTTELKYKNKELESKNKDITDSITYARRIQEAMLPDKQKFYQTFPEAFILYKPKDIVSGDFYFFAEKDNNIIIASVDCTGHGVPGALMSMIGANFLNQIVNENGVVSPPAILNLMHSKVVNTLKRESKDLGTIDGMDMGLISYNRSTRQLVFSGAVRPMYFYNKDGINVIKGDKHSIGGVIDKEYLEFNSVTVEANKGDTLYLFTDGIVDQFGGEKNKKFMSQRLKDTLLQVQSKSMAEQQAILDSIIETWKGNNAQIDDILIIGIRI